MINYGISNQSIGFIWDILSGIADGSSPESYADYFIFWILVVFVIIRLFFFFTIFIKIKKNISIETINVCMLWIARAK